MWLFRKGLDLSRTVARSVAAGDLVQVSRLLRNGNYRYLGIHGSELAALLEAGLGVALVTGTDLWGVAIAGWPTRSTAWLRGLALVEGIEAQAGIMALLPALHATLVARGVSNLFYASEENSEAWLDPTLRSYGYVFSTEVIVYEKRELLCPAAGNQQILVRTAVPADLADVLEIDQRCFEAQWTKDGMVLGPAIAQGPLFLVAELHGRLLGYSYATTHFGGQLVHLVRIAVDPAMQGRGFGIRLLAEVIDFARNVGAETVTLNTQSYNLHAQQLYRWFGFHPTGERQQVLQYDLIEQASHGQ